MIPPRFLAAFALVVGLPIPARAESPVSELLPVEYRAAVASQLEKAGENAGNLADAIREAPPDQREAVGFLVANMPERDLKALGKDFLLRNVRLAYLAREATPWAVKVPRELFFDAVLPYASVNERRDDWRQDFYDRFIQVARESPTPGEAVKRLNVEVFKTFNVQYHATKRPKPDQSPYESAAAGYASCTGLSILLIDACRAVGVPARMVGTPRWTDNSGNHSWVTLWYGDNWFPLSLYASCGDGSRRRLLRGQALTGSSAREPGLAGRSGSEDKTVLLRSPHPRR